MFGKKSDNYYIKQQCINMALTVQTFENACREAVNSSYVSTSAADSRALGRIASANAKYLRALEKVTT